jgi:TolB-like protein
MQIWSAEIKELESLYTSLKGRFPELEKELEQLIETKDPNVVMLYSRRCLEVIVTNLCECELKRPRKTEPLKGIIDKLNSEQMVPSYIITSMDHLNSLSTYGTHPKEFDPEQVRPILLNLATIIKWYVKYKDTQTLGKAKPEEEEKHEIKKPDNSKEPIRIPKNRVIALSGFFLVVIIMIVVLFVFNVIGGRKQVAVDTDLKKSIAVLPFKNFSTDPDQEYMSDGLTDEIINHLYKIKSFDKVVSLSSILTYKGTDKKIPQIANELKVNYILEGTYKKIGEQVRVTAQLIEPKNDKHLWQNEYDKPYKEIIAIQSDIALQIADNVKAFLTISEKQNIQKNPTTSQEAYELMKQAGNLWSTSSYDALTDLFLKVIELDPNYSNAYAQAGMSILLKGSYLGGSEMQSVVWEAVPYFEKALELDQNNSDAHNGLALFNEWIKWDYIQAEKEFLKAIEISPNAQWLYEAYIEFLSKRNRLEDALSYLVNIEISLAGMTKIHVMSGALSTNKRDAYNSINALLKADGVQAYSWAGEDFLWLEEYDSAKLYLESAVQAQSPKMSAPRFQADLAMAYYKTKNYQKARAIIKQIINRSSESSAGSPEYFTGWYYSGIGEVDSAFYWLEKAYKNRSPEMPWLKVNPAFKNLKDDYRYWDLYERTGHKAYDEYMEGMKK